MILFAWIVTWLYLLVSALSTNRIKRREAFRERLLDSALFFGGYFLMFSPAQILSTVNLHFVPLQIGGVVLTYVGFPLAIWSRARFGTLLEWGRGSEARAPSDPVRPVSGRASPPLFGTDFGSDRFQSVRHDVEQPSRHPFVDHVF